MTGEGIIGHTTLGWAVSIGDRLVSPDGAGYTVLGREGNLVLARHFIPGRRTYIGRTHGKSSIVKLHPSTLGIKSIKGSLPICL